MRRTIYDPIQSLFWWVINGLTHLRPELGYLKSKLAKLWAGSSHVNGSGQLLSSLAEPVGK